MRKVTNNTFDKLFKKERKYIYLITILSLITITYFIQTIAFFSNENFIYFILLTIIFLVVDFLIIKRHSKNSKTISTENENEYKKVFDKYSKKCMIWLFIIFMVIFGNIFNAINLGFNSRASEIIEMLFNSWSMIEIFLFFFIKNILIMIWLNKNIEFKNEKEFKRIMNKTLIVSIIFFIVSLGLYYGFEKFFVINITPAIIIVYFIFALFIYFVKRKKFSYNKKGINNFILVPIIVVLLVFGGYSFLSRDIWLTQPYINSTPYIYEGENKISYNEETGVYTIKNNKDDFKILQLTDIHLGGGVLSYDKDLKALKAAYKLIDYTKPDLVVVTGDLTYPLGVSSFSFNNTAPVQQFAAFMRNTGVPWAFTYGNHDIESVSIAKKDDLNELYKSLSYKTSRNLLYPYVQPNITGRSNQLIEVRNSDGTLNQALFLIDSNAYVGQGFSKYDYIHDDQVEWYKSEVERLNNEEGKTISSLGFFHIPLQQYKTAYELYEKGSNEVKYYFGSNDEKMFDKVCASEYPSKLFDTALELGSTKGFFCGHDHYNNMSLEYQGIRLTYGMSIDYLVMPGIARDTKQRGATLITSHRDSSVDIKQIPLTSIEQYYK